jgi:hypothetical protein
MTMRSHRVGMQVQPGLEADPGTPSPADVRFGTAYFGVRDPDHAARDFDEMRQAGYDWVVLPMTQDDAVWEVRTFGRLVELAETRGLDPIVSLWGGTLFGGEGGAGPLDLHRWLDRAQATGARTLHIDEPKLSASEIDGLLGRWEGPVWMTLEPHRARLLASIRSAAIDVVGTDAYGGSTHERVAATEAFGLAAGRLDLAWVQAFRIPHGAESSVRESLVAMAGRAPRIGVWAWKGSVGRGEIGSDRPRHVEAAVRAGMAAVRSGSSSWRRPAQGAAT